jgi:hypothetical protein
MSLKILPKKNGVIKGQEQDGVTKMREEYW